MARRISYQVTKDTPYQSWNIDWEVKTFTVFNPTKYNIFILIGSTNLPSSKTFSDICASNSSYVADPAGAQSFAIFVDFAGDSAPSFPLPIVVTFSQGAASVNAALASAFSIGGGGGILRYCRATGVLTPFNPSVHPTDLDFQSLDLNSGAAPGDFTLSGGATGGINIPATGKYLMSVTAEGNFSAGAISGEMYIACTLDTITFPFSSTYLAMILFANNITVPAGYTQLRALTSGQVIRVRVDWAGNTPTFSSFRYSIDLMQIA